MAISDDIRNVRSAEKSAGMAAEWLRLAAMPVFGAMTLTNAVQGPADGLCAAAHGMPPLHGMALMYGLMAVFHLPPWIRRFAGQSRLPQSTSQTEGNR